MSITCAGTPSSHFGWRRRSQTGRAAQVVQRSPRQFGLYEDRLALPEPSKSAGSHMTWGFEARDKIYVMVKNIELCVGDSLIHF